MKTEQKHLSSGFSYFALNGKYLVSGQPGPSDIPLLKREAGALRVINLRGEEETAALPFNPAELMKENEVSYSSIPLMRAGILDIENLRKISEILFSLKEGERALVHCAAGQRASIAVTGAHIITGAITKDEAPALAKRLGLKKDDLLRQLSLIPES